MKTKKIFVWAHYDTEKVVRLCEAILTILKTGKKVSVTIEEMEWPEKADLIKEIK